VDGWRETLKRGLGTSFVFASDEFYLMTGQPVPDTGYYETYPLVENGVGMVRRFEDAFHARLGELSRSAKSPRLTVVTGALGGGFMPDLLARMERAAGLRSDLVVVRNRFFGEGITVSGLLTGADIRDALLAAPRGDAILLPPNCLSHHGLFLDDGRPDDLQRELGVPVRVGSYDLVESVRKILEGVEDPIGSDPPVTSHPYLLPVLHA
jgi:NifB/MoaA-like Fe-S oxidoreductase